MIFKRTGFPGAFSLIMVFEAVWSQLLIYNLSVFDTDEMCIC